MCSALGTDKEVAFVVDVQAEFVARVVAVLFRCLPCVDDFQLTSSAVVVLVPMVVLAVEIVLVYVCLMSPIQTVW